MKETQQRLRIATSAFKRRVHTQVRNGDGERQEDGRMTKGPCPKKLYNHLSNAGTHRLGSAPEQVRVSKNMLIELALLIAGRVQALQRQP